MNRWFILKANGKFLSSEEAMRRTNYSLITKTDLNDTLGVVYDECSWKQKVVWFVLKVDVVCGESASMLYKNVSLVV